MSNGLIFDHYPLKTGNLPPGWAVTSVGQVARTVASGFPCGEHNEEERGVPHIRPMNIDREGRLDLSTLKYVQGEPPRELHRGDVVFNNTNSPELIGKTTAVLTDTPFAYSNHMTRIQLEDQLNPVFVARQLHFLWMTVRSLRQGAAEELESKIPRTFGARNIEPVDTAAWLVLGNTRPALWRVSKWLLV